MVDWQHSLEQKWAALRFGDVKVETQSVQHVFEVHVYLDDLDPKAVQVELYADGVNGGDPVRQEMNMRWPSGRRIGRLRLPRGCVRGQTGQGLYGENNTPVLRWGRSTENRRVSYGNDDKNVPT